MVHSGCVFQHQQVGGIIIYILKEYSIVVVDGSFSVSKEHLTSIHT